MRLTSLVIGLLALMVSACGGSGQSISSGGTNVAPPPPPPPPPPSTVVTLIDAATTDAQFRVEGIKTSYDWITTSPIDSPDLQIRYLAATNTYQMNVREEGWQSMIPACSPVESCNQFYFDNSYNYAISTDATGGDYQFSNLIQVGAEGIQFFAGFGLATQPSDIPTTGAAQYDGVLKGGSDANWVDGWGANNAWISGTIFFDVDFASGSVDGKIDPVVTFEWNDFSLDPLTMSGHLLGSDWSNVFAGIFITNLSGTANWTGVFAGPNAEEAIGGFTFPYILPADGNQYQASGAWIAKR